jgi:hypothetical protein
MIEQPHEPTRVEFDDSGLNQKQSEQLNNYHFQQPLHYGGKIAHKLRTGGYFHTLDLTVQLGHSRKYDYTLECIIASGINAHHDKSTHGWVAISRRKTDYCTGNPTYGDLSYDAMIKIWKCLVDKQYIETYDHIPPNWIEGDPGRRTAYRLTNTFINKIEEIIQSWQSLDQEDSRVGYWLAVEKNKKKADKFLYVDTNKTEKLKAINQYQLTHVWQGPGLTPKSVQYHGKSIVQGSEDKGGRFYAPFQNIKKIHRKDWTVNNQKISEVDLKSSHLHITYKLLNVSKPEGDIYDVGLPKKCRLAIKNTMLVMLNAPTILKTKKSIAHTIENQITYATNMEESDTELLDSWMAVCQYMIENNVCKGNKILDMLADPDPYNKIWEMGFEDSLGLADSLEDSLEMSGTRWNSQTRSGNNLDVSKTNIIESGKCLANDHIDPTLNQTNIVACLEVSEPTNHIPQVSQSPPRGQVTIRGTIYPYPYLVVDSGNPTTHIYQIITWLINRIKARHSQIAAAFGTGIGIACQGVEGEIGLAVYERCMQENIPLLYLHDGFLTGEQHLHRLEEIVQEVLRRFGIAAPTEFKRYS